MHRKIAVCGASEEGYENLVWWKLSKICEGGSNNGNIESQLAI